MDLSPLTNQLARWFVFLFLAYVLIAVLKSSWFKGVFGEFFVNFLLKTQLDKNRYQLLRNVTLPTEDGTTQVDHVVVSVYGVFVLETKNMKGWIFGSEKQGTWTQKIFKHTQKFQNPLHQNYKHVKTLQSLLGLKDNQVHSIVVFIGDSTFKTEMPPNVTRGGECLRFIKSKTEEVLSEEEVNEIVAGIQAGRLTPSFRTSREHVEHVRRIRAQKDDAVVGAVHGDAVTVNNDSDAEEHVSQRVEKQVPPEAVHLQPNDSQAEIKPVTCPKCGGEMLLRQAKKGQSAGRRFWGCAKYPKCRGIVNIP